MPKTVFQRPDVENLASKLPEPLQWPVGAALGGLQHAFGGDDPQSMMPGPSGMEAAPLISIYKDAMGVPSKMLREAATDEFLNSAKTLGSEAVTGASQEFANRYPRVAAHIRINPKLDMTNDYKAITNIPPFGHIDAPIDVAYSNRGLSVDDREPWEAVDTMFHEGTHVAQALGNKWTDILYKMANKLPGGYDLNPIEQSARMSASLASGIPHLNASSEGAIRGLRKAAEAALADQTLERTSDAVRAAKTILDLINARAPK